jgi:hypothetical protein
MKVYVGNGTGWTNMTTYTTGIQWSNSLSTASPNMTANHWVLEVSADKGTAFPVWGANPPPSGLYVGMYDASNPTQGWVHWPATSADIPDRWGSIGSFGTEIPEGLSFGLIVALSSVAVVIGSVYLWKRPKTIIPVRL